MRGDSAIPAVSFLVEGDSNLLVLFGLFMAVAAAEMIWPRRRLSGATGRRWFGNLSLYAISYVLYLLPWIAAIAGAAMASAGHFGLLNRLPIPDWLHFLFAVIAIDAVYYAAHRAIHAIPPFWRVHAVHHSDPEVDVTTTLRHHPLEKILFSVLTGGVVFLLGMTETEVAAYASMALSVQMLGHANLALPQWLESLVGGFVVTPDFHRLHHSRLRRETDSNYGEVSSLWDHLFGTASRRSPEGHDALEAGLDAFREAKHQDLQRLIAQPFLPQHASTQARAATDPVQPGRARSEPRP